MSYKVAIAAAIVVVIALFAEQSYGAPPQPVVAAKDASIPFVNSGSIRDWRADGNEALYVQDVHGRWYHARLMGPCHDLPYAERIGIETRGIDTLDKFGSVIVRGQRCHIQSLVRSEAPPSKARHKGADKPAKAG